MLLQQSQRARSIRKTGKNIAIFVIMGIVALLIVSPVLWMLSASFQNQAQIFQTPFRWIPDQLQWKSYVIAWTSGNLESAFVNSIEVTLLYVPVHVFLCTLTGYVFAKFRFPGRNVIFVFILLTLLIPQEVTYFSVYGMVQAIGWLNTPMGVVLPFFYSGFGVFFMRQAALSVPTELIEAAKLDGCSDFHTFLLIALPLLQPGMAGLAILALTFIWSEYTWSHLVLSTPNAQTLPTALALLNTAVYDLGHTFDFSVLMAAGVIAVVPVMLLFLFFQSRFIESISQAGIRG